MEENKISNLHFSREIRDYSFITLGLISYTFGWSAFLLPYKITTGGLAGIGAIIFYATGFPMQWTYFLVNIVLLAFAAKILGPKFSIKTTYAIFMMTFLFWFFQLVIVDAAGHPLQLLGPNQDSMACVIGSILCGIGLGIVFSNNGSTGGTDIIAAVVHKYRDVTLGRMIMYCDIIIISSCYFVFHDWRRVIFGFVTLIIISYMLDYVINSTRRSVQFFIFSKKYAEISDKITTQTHRGVTVITGTGWYSKNEVKMLIVMAHKNQSVDIFRLIKDIDPNAFITQSAVTGVFGQGFDRLKVK